MRTHTRAKRLWLAVAAVMAAAAVMLGVAYQGNATAQSGPPPAPSNPLAHLIVPDDEDPRVRVSWDASDTDVSGYTISRADGQSFNADGNATTFSDHTIEPGTAYSYSVTAENSNGASPTSESASASVPEAPSQPSDLAAEVAEIAATDTAASVTLTWTASTVPAAAACEISYPLDGYTIVRSNGDDESEIATPDADATSFTDTSAAFETNYTYRVVARNAIDSSPAAETTVNVSVPPVPPATGLTATITEPFDGTVSLSWAAPSEGPAILGYLVFLYDGTPDPETTEELPTTISPFTVATNAADSSAQAGITYSYIVLAQSADNISNPSNIAVIEPPAPPTDVTAAAGDEVIEVSWTAAAGTAVGYRVERQQDASWTTVADTTETSHSDSAAAENSAYRYQVQHRNHYDGSAWAESGTATIIALPGTPSSVTVTSDGDDNVVSWQAPADSIVDGYRVRHRIGDGDWTTLAGDLSADDSGYTHEDAQSDVTHQYAVQAHNATGDGPWSTAVSTSRITPPLAPQDVSASIEDDDIVLSWSKPNSAHTSRRHPPQQPWLGGDVGRVERGRRRALPTLRPAWMVARGDMKDEVADFMPWLESSEDTAAPPQPVVNTDPLLARVPVARPELTQADIDRWMDKYYPEWDWQDDAVTDAQLDYLRSLLRREGLFLTASNAASMTKGQASHLIELLTEERS